MMYQHGQQLGLTSTHKFTLVAGVILPAIAITVEATTKVCAQMFFNPVPTTGHLLLVLLVPLAQLQVWFAIRRNDPNRLKLAAVANAAVIGISIFYSIIYLPLIPLAALTLLVVLGFLPLAPYFSLVSALIMRKQLRRVAGGMPRKSFPLRTTGLFAILAAMLAAIGLIELPAALTRYGLQLASSPSAQTRAHGIRFLRDYGSTDYMLRSCYDQRRRSFDLIGLLTSGEAPVTVPEAREIYYRVTGETFDMSPPPRTVNGRMVRDDFEFEESADGTKTTRVLKGLSLSKSKINGSVDADGGVSNLNWILDFENSSDSQREVRAEIQLPPGAVISDVTHWSRGEEQKAQFTGRSVLNAPGRREGGEHLRLLVTTTGRDRVLIQSYPIHPFNNGITIRLGITAPLVLQEKEEARLILPHFVSRNFHVPRKARHWIMIDSKRPLSSDFGLAVHSVARPNNNDYQLLGEFTDTEIMRPDAALRVSRPEGDYVSWSRNPFGTAKTLVKQTVVEHGPNHLQRLVIVVDTSASMAEWQSQIKAALGSLPRNLDVKVVLADGEWRYETENEPTVVSGINAAVMRLSGVPFEGGADNAPALIKAWDVATDTPGNNAIVWIHSPQPVLIEPIQPLISRWETGYYGPSLYSVQTSVGPDAIEKKLDGVNEVKSVVRLGTLRQDLERLFGQLSGQLPTFEFVRSTARSPLESALAGVETSDQLARLWASDEVTRILSSRNDSLREAATMLALQYQLVTPASGAVIQDYPGQLNSGDLEPAESSGYALGMETDFGSLLFLAALFLGWLSYLKARGPRVCPI